MRRDDRLRLQHMVDAGREAVRFIHGKTRGDLDRDRVLALALVKLLEIVGEAASRVTAEGQRTSPDIPWRDIVAMRNRLIHGSFDVDLDRVWDTVTDDLPPLLARLEAALARPDSPAEASAARRPRRLGLLDLRARFRGRPVAAGGDGQRAAPDTGASADGRLTRRGRAPPRGRRPAAPRGHPA